MIKNQRKKGMILSYLNILLGTLINIISVPMFLNYININEYGLYQIMGSLIAYFVILDFGLPATVVYFYSKYSSENNNGQKEIFLSICSKIYIFITFMIFLVGLILYFKLNFIYKNYEIQELNNLKNMYLILLINVIITLPFQIFNAIITAHEKFVFLKSLSIFINVFQAISIFLFINKFPFAITIVTVQTFFNIITSFFRAFYCIKFLKIKISFSHFNKELFLKIVKYSSVIFLNVIVEQFFWRSNFIILSILNNSVSAAAYSIVFQITYNYMILSTAITGVFLPKVIDLVTKKNEKKLSNLFIEVGKLESLILGLVLTGFILFGKEFISIWSLKEPGFENSYIMTLLILIPLSIDLIQGLGQTILQAVNKFYFRVILFLFIDFINIFLSILLIKKYGEIACSAVSGTTLIISNIVLNIYYQKNLKLDIKDFWLKILKNLFFALISFTIGIFINLINANLIIKIMLYFVVYTIIMYVCVIKKNSLFSNNNKKILR
ncbi:MAG: oligosaccharide flippase family protein [Candidatus Paraimprobicoccus trichonymphae]|uniref:Oligosaccharide flippase family protein n=1 Tax=Candidatus Paraimprobicoccus trichonymphae TaxID=3033793 RepID=A0AA48I215_9FIRM|nr:MAG: oligosaccharide flippase family protein [Candidatus Paraimprobicoccus trichonymphae]